MKNFKKFLMFSLFFGIFSSFFLKFHDDYNNHTEKTYLTNTYSKQNNLENKSDSYINNKVQIKSIGEDIRKNYHKSNVSSNLNVSLNYLKHTKDIIRSSSSINQELNDYRKIDAKKVFTINQLKVSNKDLYNGFLSENEYKNALDNKIKLNNDQVLNILNRFGLEKNNSSGDQLTWSEYVWIMKNFNNSKYPQIKNMLWKRELISLDNLVYKNHINNIDDSKYIFRLKNNILSNYEKYKIIYKYAILGYNKNIYEMSYMKKYFHSNEWKIINEIRNNKLSFLLPENI